MGDRYLNIGERGNFVIQEYSTFSFCADYKNRDTVFGIKIPEAIIKKMGRFLFIRHKKKLFLLQNP